MSVAFVSETFHTDFVITSIKHTESFKNTLSSISPEQIQLALTLASQAVLSVDLSVKNAEYRDALAAEIQKCTEVFEADKKQLENEIEQQIRKNSSEKDNLVSVHTREIQSVKKQIQDIISKSDLDKERILSEHSKIINELQIKLKDSQKHLEEEKETLQRTHSKDLHALQDKIRELKSEITISDYTSSKLKEQFETLKHSSESIMRQSIEEIVKQKEVQYENEIKRLQESHKLFITSVEENASKRVAQCDLQHRQAHEQLKAIYSETESKLRKDLEKTSISSEKGKAGEKEFDELTQQYTSWGPLKNTSTTPHSADRYVKIRNCETLIEVKKYSSDVPTKELEKFYRDMEEHQGTPLGVMISLHTRIVGKKSAGFITTEWTHKSQLLVFINTFYTHQAEDILTFIDLCADIAWKVYKQAQDTPQESDVNLELNSRIQQVKIYVEKELKRMSDMLTTLNLDKKSLTETIAKQYANYTYNIQQSKQALQRMVSILLREPQVEEIVIEIPTASPEKKIKKPKNKKEST